MPPKQSASGSPPRSLLDFGQWFWAAPQAGRLFVALIPIPSILKIVTNGHKKKRVRPPKQLVQEVTSPQGVIHRPPPPTPPNQNIKYRLFLINLILLTITQQLQPVPPPLTPARAIKNGNQGILYTGITLQPYKPYSRSLYTTRPSHPHAEHARTAHYWYSWNSAKVPF